MSLELPLTESDDDDMGEVFVGEEHQDESEDELAEVFEIQKKAKRDFKKTSRPTRIPRRKSRR